MIELNNLTTNKIDGKFLKEVAKKVLVGEKKEAMEISIVLVGQGRIKELNRKYRQKNKVTDILSFLYDNSGEIVICPREIKKNVKRFKSTFKKELARIMIHGVLHLLGYSHLEMRGKEEYYLLKV